MFCNIVADLDFATLLLRESLSPMLATVPQFLLETTDIRVACASHDLRDWCIPACYGGNTNDVSNTVVEPLYGTY